MTSDIDANKVVALASAEIIKNSFETILSKLSDNMATVWRRVSEDFSNYANKSYAHNRNIRIICCGDADVDLYDVYVPASFRNSKSEIIDRELIEKYHSGQNIILSGAGGSGKTLFIRHLWLTLFENPYGRIPVFVELRSLNELTEGDLINLIRLTLSPSGELSEDDFKYFCEVGSFFFLLDGLDELNESLRDKISKRILSMSRVFDKCPIFLTSRPDNMFMGWTGFDVYQCCNFNFNQSKELVSKVPFDEKRRDLFLRNFDIAFFNKYEAFLSNPLLSIILLMTFRDHLHIPEKLTTFYHAAFNALYTFHDSTKFYIREKYLSRSEFEKVFGVFCLLSYYDEVYEFSQDRILIYIRKSQKILQSEYEEEKLVEDFTRNVCLMIQDGLSYTFVHRSFQEFFSAVAIAGPMSSHISKLMPKFIGRRSESLLPMAYEINEELIVKSVIIPFYENNLSHLRARFKKEEPYYILSKIEFKSPIFFSCTDNELAVIMTRVTSILDIAKNIERSLSSDHGDKKMLIWGDSSTQFMAIAKLVEKEIYDYVDFEDNNDEFLSSINIIFTEKSYDFEELYYTSESEESELAIKVMRLGRKFVEEKDLGLDEIFESVSRDVHRAFISLRGMCERRIEKSKMKIQSLDEIFD